MILRSGRSQIRKTEGGRIGAMRKSEPENANEMVGGGKMVPAKS